METPFAPTNAAVLWRAVGLPWSLSFSGGSFRPRFLPEDIVEREVLPQVMADYAVPSLLNRWAFILLRPVLSLDSMT